MQTKLSRDVSHDIPSDYHIKHRLLRLVMLVYNKTRKLKAFFCLSGNIALKIILKYTIPV